MTGKERDQFPVFNIQVKPVLDIGILSERKFCLLMQHDCCCDQFTVFIFDTQKIT